MKQLIKSKQNFWGNLSLQKFHRNNRTMLEKNSVALKKNITTGIYGIHNIQSYSYEFDKLSFI